MLVLSRKKGESIVIGDNVEITVLDIQGENIKIGINAPRSLKIYRKEIYTEIIVANKEAMKSIPNVELLTRLSKLNEINKI